MLSSLSLTWILTAFTPMSDLREDKQFQMDYPGACTISIEQVKYSLTLSETTLRFLFSFFCQISREIANAELGKLLIR